MGGNPIKGFPPIQGEYKQHEIPIDARFSLCYTILIVCLILYQKLTERVNVMKRLLPILLSAAIAVTGTAVPVSAADTAITETETALSWWLQDGCLEVWGEGDMPNYDKEDNPHPFSDQNREVTSLKIEEGVTSIGEYAFCGCTGLNAVVLPKSVKRIGSGAFDGSSYFHKNAVFVIQNPDCEIAPDTEDAKTLGYVGTIFGYAGSKAEAYAKEHNIPFYLLDAPNATETDVTWSMNADGVLTIGGKGNMKNYDPAISDRSPFALPLVREIIIADGVTAIGSNAFAGCQNLTAVSIPDSVTFIAARAFFDCGNLVSAELPEHLQYIGEDAFGYCEMLESVAIPESVRYLMKGAFDSCYALWDVTLPYHLQDAAYSAFMSTPFFDTLPSPQILPPEDEYSDDEYLENDCIEDEDTQTDGTIHDHGKLKTADGITYVLTDGEAFVLSCADAETVTIPASIDSVHVTRICDGAFDGCTALQSVTIPASAELPHVGDVELGDGLYTEVNGVKTLFANCTALKEVLLDGDSEQYISHDGVLYDKASNSLIFCPAAKTSIDFLAGVTAIGLHAMEGVQITELTLPNSVRSISLYAFAGSKLQKVVLPSGLKLLEYYVFGDCTDLTEVVLPISLTEIHANAFYNCTSLREIEIPANLVQMFSYYDGEKWAEIGPFNVVYVDDSGEYDRTYYPNNPVLVIKCYEDTVAEHYAADSDIVFENIGKKPIIGDLNADTKVSIADAVVLGRIINEDAPESYDETVFKYADLNYDGMYTVTDLLMLMKKLRK